MKKKLNVLLYWCIIKPERAGKLFLLLIAMLVCRTGFAQGCSDAGLCSFGSLNILGFKYVNLPADEVKLSPVTAVDPGIDGVVLKTGTEGNDTIIKVVMVKDTNYTSPLTSVEFTSYYGIGEHNTLIMINQLEGNFKLIDKKLYAQVKLPYSIISGNLGTVSGLSDITMSLSYVPFKSRVSNLSFALGVKIPANASDLSKNGRPLPMAYQTSLGSTDLLAGARFTYKKWDFTTGYQHTFNPNSNQYLHLPGISDSLTYNGYFESRNMRRADDGIFRINRKFNVKKVRLNTSLLFIYHMANDDITAAGGERIKATGSQGLTFNFDFAGSIPVTKRMNFTFVLAKPLIQRKYVTDGLARSFVGIAGLRWNF